MKKTPKKKKSQPENNEPESTSIIAPERNQVGRKCSVCLHFDVVNINSMIGESKSFRYISLHYRKDASWKDSLCRHAENCLKLDIAALIEEKRIAAAVEHYEEIRVQLEFSKELQAAAREWLTDPKTGKMTVTPRAEEIEIVYLDRMDLDRNFNPRKKRESLQEIIDNVQQVKEGFDYKVALVKTVDLRKYALETVEVVDKVLDKFARVDGHYQKERDSSVEVENLRKKIQQVSERFGTDYQTELKLFLEDAGLGGKLRPDIKAELGRELK